MAKDPFLLVSLEESESKKLAQVISNDTARKILDYLSKNEKGTESEISAKLKIPLSTVHYNLQALSKANLVKAEEFHYSEKGKEVLHYSLANKIIIIAPKKQASESFLQKLKSLMPALAVSVGAAAILQAVQHYLSASKAGKATLLMDNNIMAASKIAQESQAEAISLAAQPAPDMALAPLAAYSGDYTALWFLAGSLIALLAMLVWNYIQLKKK